MKLALGGQPLAQARGLAVKEAAFGTLRPDLLAEVVRIRDEDELVPGEEVEIVVSVPELRPNADVKSIGATLFASASTEPGTPETTEVAVRSGSSTQEFGVDVKPVNLPRNVQVRLAGGEVFWSHSGTLEADEHPLPDFTEHANAYLDRAPLPPGRHPTLAFLVRSDTPGRVRIEVGTPTYAVLQTETWTNPLDGSVRIDRNLELDFGRIDRIDLDGFAGAGIEGFGLARVTLDVTGDLGPERLLGRVTTHDGSQFATISSDFSVAQAIRLDGDADVGSAFTAGTRVRVAGVTGAVQIEGETELYVEIRNDANGKPGTDPPLASRTLTLPPDDPEAPRRWLFVAFDAPAELELDRDYWVVLRGIRGVARLGLTAAAGGYLGLVRVNRGGQLWKRVDRRAEFPPTPPSLVTVLRLVYLPEPDNQTAAVALAVDGNAPALVDPEAAAQRVTVEAPGHDGPAALVVTSNARGSLMLANIVQEFGEQPRRRL